MLIGQKLHNMNLQPTFKIYRSKVKPILLLSNSAVEKRIINVIETITDLKFVNFMNESRKRELVFARHLYAYLMYNFTSLSLNHIGRKVKPKRIDAHDNIIHSRSVIETIVDFPKDQKHQQVMKAIDMMNGYKRIKQATAITNKVISQALKLQKNKL